MEMETEVEVCEHMSGSMHGVVCCGYRWVPGLGELGWEYVYK